VLNNVPYQTQSNKNLKVYLEIFILKYDVIYDALTEICYKNLKRQRNVGDFASGRNFAKNREIAEVFWRYWQIWQYLPGDVLF
jgi:hypothetical protein